MRKGRKGGMIGISTVLRHRDRVMIVMEVNRLVRSLLRSRAAMAVAAGDLLVHGHLEAQPRCPPLARNQIPCRHCQVAREAKQTKTKRVERSLLLEMRPKGHDSPW